MGWIRVDDTIRDHPKVKRAAKQLGLSPVVIAGHLTWLWTWVNRLAPDGDLSSFDDAAVEEAAGWECAPGGLVEALVAHRLLDRSSTGELAIHDWLLFQPTQREKERKRVWRASRVPPGTAAGTNSTERNGTERNGTEQPEGTAPKIGARPPNAVLVFPAIGTGDQTWTLTREHLDALKTAYPGISVEADLMKAHVKVTTGAVRPKTPRGYPRFIASWLDRTVNSGRAPTAAAQPRDTRPDWMKKK